MFADVLILRPESTHDQVLTYLVPEEMKVLLPGFLVSVALRQHIEKGLVLKTYHEKPKLECKIKPIKEILSEDVQVTPGGLEMAHWISRYYVCSLNKAIHLFLPPPIRQKEKKLLVLGKHDGSEHLLLGKIEQDILVYIKKKGRSNRTTITRRFGAEGQSALEFLLKYDLLRTETVFESNFAEKKKTMIAVTDNTLDLREIEKKAPKQAAILHALLNGPRSMEELKTISPKITTVVKTMEKKGWLDVYEMTERRSPFAGKLRGHRPESLNTQQRQACKKIIESIRNREKKDWLLFGVTGSGKTEVYLQAIEATLQHGRQVLYLVPEIALTPQITSLLLDSFGAVVAMLHSNMAAGERYDEWLRIRRKEARVILGPRSAIFAPFTDLGLIIIDEEHENTYKQSEPEPRYDTRRVARELAEYFQAVTVRGSATPSLHTYEGALKGKYELLRLPLRVASRPIPEINIVDMKKEAREGNASIFSRYLLDSLERALGAGEQAILFMNRRGFHTFVFCRECGESLSCPQCSISLTYHRQTNRLVCHYCNYQRSLPPKCPSCGSSFLQYYGTGTERVARELETHFPQIVYTRMDTDTTQRKGSHFQMLQQFQEGKTQVLIGTQMVAKGLDFPEVTLVGIISADTLLNMPDYQSSERAYQLLTQVAGRAGRGEKRGEVVLQTYNPDHYLFPAVVNHNYEEFFKREIDNRTMLKYPPVHYLVRVLVSGLQEKKVVDRVDYLMKLLKIEIRKNGWEVEVIGPAPAPIFYLKGRFRYHFILKGMDLDILQDLALKVRSKTAGFSLEPRIIIDVEPQNLL